VADLDFDLVIVGGGPVGAMLACTLARHGERIALLEGSSADLPLPPSYDERALALALGSQRMLATAGVWDGLANRATPMLRIDIAQQHFPGRTVLDCADENVAALGYVTSARDLGTALYRRLATSAVTLLRPARVRDLGRERGCVRLDLDGVDGPRQLRSRLVVAADGARSTVRERAAIAAHWTDYRQRALIADIVPGFPAAGTAFERFTPDGPLALLPRPAGCSLVWTVTPDNADRLLAADDGEFIAQLQAAFGNALGTLRTSGPRRAYPLQGLRVATLVRGRVVLVGNAAHQLHPIAGQGLNLGLRDVARLGVLLDDALSHGADPGASRLLALYAADRTAAHAHAYTFTDGLLALFAGRALPLRLVRGAGLAGFDRLALLKHRLAVQTMGLAGRDGCGAAP